MRPNSLEINFSEMIPLKMPVSNRNPGMTLRVTERGLLSMNSVLLKNVKEQNPNMEIGFYHSADYRIVALRGGKQTGNMFRFHQDGRIRHQEFMAELRERGYLIPARYIVEWNPGANAWVGLLEEVPELDNPQNIVKSALAKNKRKKDVRI